MMKSVAVTKTLNAQASNVWKIISAGGGVDTWLPLITSCEILATSATWR